MGGISFERTKLKYLGKRVATINRFTKDELSKIAKTFNNKGQIIEANEFGDVLQVTCLFRETVGYDLVVELNTRCEDVKYAAMKSKNNEKWFPVIYEEPSTTRVFSITLIEKSRGYLIIAAHPGFATNPSPTDENLINCSEKIEDAESYWKNHAFCAPACYENKILDKESETEKAPW